MVWQDRDYNRGGYGDAGDYLANPSGILGLSVPFGTWLGVRVRLHFWLLLSFVFILVQLIHNASPVVVLGDIGLILAALLLHDFGHKAAAGWAGGDLNEFMLWPAGGMVFPQVPPGVSRQIVGYGGGLAVNLLLAVGSFTLLRVLTGEMLPIVLRDPLMSLGNAHLLVNAGEGELLPVFVANFAYINWGLVIVNLLPFFWFDGGFLWRAILSPMTGGATALNITCIAGMLLAGVMFTVSLADGPDLLMMVVWAFLFSSAYTARTQMMFEDGVEPYSAYGAAGDVYGGPGPAGRIRSGRWAAKSQLRAQAKRRREEQKIDEILAKVSAKGMQSLTWMEKRTLRKGSKRRR